MASNGSPICKKYLSILEADANVVLTRQNCRVNTVGNSSMTIYNNYNMLDGRLNNEPPVRPDLTDGQTDEEIRELVPEAKPSLMDRLKADKPEHEARQMIPPVPERER